MKLVKKRNNQIIFKAEMNESVANSIRRYVLQIPVMAVDEVEISKNDSPLYDETIAHRLGLIPLKMEKFGDKKVKLKLSLKKEGMVYSGDLKGSIKPVYNNTPITTLSKGQELELVATMRLGKGVEHAKFSPGLMFYRNIVDIKVDKNCPLDVIDTCPKEIFSSKGGNVLVRDTLACDFCGACLDFLSKKKKECIKIESTNELLITIESFGQISPEDILKKSIDVLKKDLAFVGKAVSKA